MQTHKAALSRRGTMQAMTDPVLTSVDKASCLCCPAHPNQQNKVQGEEQEVAKADTQDGSLASA